MATKVKIQGSMRLGDTGVRIKGMQTMLADYGYPLGAIDGYFGKKTHEAVRSYQSSQGLTADGIVGPKTWARLCKITVGKITNIRAAVPRFTTLVSSRTVKLWTIDGQKTFKVWAQSKSDSAYVRGSGCALSSTLMAAYPFRKGIPTPGTFHSKIEKGITGRSDAKSGCPLGPAGAVKILKHYNISATWKPYKVSLASITKHLESGRPVLIWLIDKTGKYTSYLHTVLLAGITDDGKWIMLDSGGRKLDGRYSVKICDNKDVYDHIRFCASGKADKKSLYWKGESSTTGIVLVDI